MKTPALLAGTALIGITIGFIAGNQSSQTSGKVAQTRGEEVAPRTSSSRRSGSSRDGGKPGGSGATSGSVQGRDVSKMSAADVMSFVKANGEMTWGGDPLDSAKKNYEYQLMLSKLPISMMEEVMKLSKESGVPGYRTRQIFSAFAARDLQKALAWASTQPDADSWKGAAISVTATHDPARAMEMLEEGILNGKFNNYGGSMTEGGYALAADRAKQGKVALLQFLDTMPSSSVSNLLSMSLRNLPKQDLPDLLEEIGQRVKDGKVEQWTLNNVIQNLASTDSAAALTWVAKMESGQEKAKQELTLAGALNQQGKTSEALELLKSAMAEQPGKEKEFFINQAGNLMYNNQDLIGQFATALPEGMEITTEDVKKLGDRGGRQDLVFLAKLLKSPDDQAAYLQEAITKWGTNTKLNETDFRVLTHRLESLGLTGSGAADVQEALAARREKVLGKN